MKIDRKINRRRFLKTGLLWGGLFALFPVLKLGERKGKEARHYRHLAG